MWSFFNEGECTGDFIIDPTSGEITLSSEAVLESGEVCGEVTVRAVNEDASVEEGILGLTITITEAITAVRLRLKLFLEGPL